MFNGHVMPSGTRSYLSWSSSVAILLTVVFCSWGWAVRSNSFSWNRPELSQSPTFTRANGITLAPPSYLRRSSGLACSRILGRDSLVCQVQRRPNNCRSRLSNRQKRSIKHPENILRKEAAESAVLGSRIGLDKKRAMRTDYCSLCSRMDGKMTFHHLIPRATHGKRWCFVRYTKEERASGVCLCRDCHDQVHKHISEKDLALEFNTLERLQTHPGLRSYVDDKSPWSWLSVSGGREGLIDRSSKYEDKKSKFSRDGGNKRKA